MPNSKPWRCNKPWLLPKGLFDNSTSPITPAGTDSPSVNNFAPSLAPRVSTSHLHQTQQSKPLISYLQTVLRPPTNDHGMTHTHLETYPEDKNTLAGTEVRGRTTANTNEQCHPAPWPMPPRRDYDSPGDAVAPVSRNVQRFSENVEKLKNETFATGPNVLEIARRLMSEESFSQSDYQTPPESIDGNEEIEADDNDSTDTDTRIPRAVFDRIAKLYPPAPRAPTFPDFKDLFKSEDSPTSSSHSVTGLNDQDLKSNGNSESSSSVVDVLQLFTDSGEAETCAVEENGILQPPSIDHIRIHRRQAPLPSGVGDKSFLNVNGLRSLFDDKHIPASRTFSTLPPDSVTKARANALCAPDSPTRGGNFPRSQSDIPRASTRIVPKSPGPPVGRNRSIGAPKTEHESASKQKKKKRKKRRSTSSVQIESNSAITESRADLTSSKTDQGDSQLRTPPRLGNRTAASQVVPDSPSMNLSPSSAAAASVPSSPGGSEVFNFTRRSKFEQPEQKQQLLNKQQTQVNPRMAIKNRNEENEKGANKVGMVGRGTGIFIRENMRRPPMNGIVRAETGWIAGPGELHEDGPPTAMQENPNPKSLATFNVDDAVTQSTVYSGTRPMTRSNEFYNKDSDSDSSLLEEPLSRSLVNLSMQVRGGSAASSSSDGVNRINSRTPEQERDDGRSSQATEEASFKLVHRLRRAAGALGVRKKIGEAVDTGTSDLTMAGTLDEAMVRICYVCRKVLDYRVDVRDGGRKIRVESKEAPSTGLCLRVTLSLTEVGDVDKKCTLKVLQSRGDANRTNIATLWDFYRKLEKHLRRIEETGFVRGNTVGPSGSSGRGASSTNVRGSTSTTAVGNERAKIGSVTGSGASGNRKHDGNG